jgi:hypothetical protein
LFASVAIVLTDSVHVVTATSLNEGLIAGLKQQQFYSDLKELELHKAIPFALFAVFALSIYLFDRTVSFLGHILPPFPEWHGSPALYANHNQLLGLWLLLPHLDNPAALDFEARTIIERTQIEGKSLPGNSREYLETGFTKAARTLNYGKVGLLWVLIVSAYVLIAGQPSVSTVLATFTFLVVFCSLAFLGIVRETQLLIAQTEEDIRVAEAILRAQGARSADSSLSVERMELFEKLMKASISYTKRFVGVKWRPQGKWSSLMKAFLGFRPTTESRRRRHS